MAGEIRISALCFIFLIQILAGCVAVTGEKAATTGADGGAVPGTAAAGAARIHKVRQLKARDEVVSEIAYTPQQGAVAKIRNTVAMPRAIRPGDRLTLRAEYTVLAPAQDDEVRVREARLIFFNDQQLAELPEWELTLKQGTHEIEFPLTLPKEAADGTYRVLTTVEPVGPGNRKRGHELTPFVVAR